MSQAPSERSAVEGSILLDHLIVIVVLAALLRPIIVVFVTRRSVAGWQRKQRGGCAHEQKLHSGPLKRLAASDPNQCVQSCRSHAPAETRVHATCSRPCHHLRLTWMELANLFHACVTTKAGVPLLTSEFLLRRSNNRQPTSGFRPRQPQRKSKAGSAF